METWRPQDDFDSESDEEQSNYYKEYSGREAIIFLVDAFLSKNPDRFQDCLDIIRKALLNGLLIKEKDLIGLVFCNTEHKPNPKDIDGIKNIVVKENTAVLLPLRTLTKDIVSYYMNFSSKDNDHFDFNNTYGCKIGSFSNSIWLCTNMFKQCGMNLISSTIIMFTDHDIPPDVKNGDFQQAIKKASDLNETEIDFNVIPMCNDFDYEKFYKEFICTVQDIELDNFIIPIPEEERDLVSERQLRQNFKKQCNYRLRWTLNDGLEISIAMYKYYKKNVQPKSVKLLREDNSIVQVKHVYKIGAITENAEGNHDTIEERICRPGDERKVITIGGQKIVFTSDELAKMRSPLTPRLILLGFKPRNIISIHNFIRSTSFMYPDENVIEGSTKLFRTLWEKCLEKDKIAICVLVSRRKSPPRYVALVPIVSSSNDQDTITADYIQKDGFKVIYLPFEIDYRDIDLNDWKIPDDLSETIHIELFKKIIKKLKYQFAPTKIHDPQLEKIQKDILGLALDLEPEDEIIDTTIDIEHQNSRIKTYLNDLKNAFGEDQVESKKRRAGGETGGPQQKTQKSITDDIVAESQILELLAAKNLEKLTVKQLRTYLQSKDVKGISSATKPVLVDKVHELHS